MYFVHVIFFNKCSFSIICEIKIWENMLRDMERRNVFDQTSEGRRLVNLATEFEHIFLPFDHDPIGQLHLLTCPCILHRFEKKTVASIFSNSHHNSSISIKSFADCWSMLGHAQKHPNDDQVIILESECVRKWAREEFTRLDSENERDNYAYDPKEFWSLVVSRFCGIGQSKRRVLCLLSGVKQDDTAWLSTMVTQVKASSPIVCVMFDISRVDKCINLDIRWPHYVYNLEDSSSPSPVLDMGVFKSEYRNQNRLTIVDNMHCDLYNISYTKGFPFHNKDTTGITYEGKLSLGTRLFESLFECILNIVPQLFSLLEQSSQRLSYDYISCRREFAVLVRLLVEYAAKDDQANTCCLWCRCHHMRGDPVYLLRLLAVITQSFAALVFSNEELWFEKQGDLPNTLLLASKHLELIVTEAGEVYIRKGTGKSVHLGPVYTQQDWKNLASTLIVINSHSSKKSEQLCRLPRPISDAFEAEVQCIYMLATVQSMNEEGGLDCFGISFKSPQPGSALIDRVLSKHISLKAYREGVKNQRTGALSCKETETFFVDKWLPIYVCTHQWQGCGKRVIPMVKLINDPRRSTGKYHTNMCNAMFEYSTLLNHFFGNPPLHECQRTILHTLVVTLWSLNYADWLISLLAGDVPAGNSVPEWWSRAHLVIVQDKDFMNSDENIDGLKSLLYSLLSEAMVADIKANIEECVRQKLTTIAETVERRGFKKKCFVAMVREGVLDNFANSGEKLVAQLENISSFCGIFQSPESVERFLTRTLAGSNADKDKDVVGGCNEKTKRLYEILLKNFDIDCIVNIQKKLLNVVNA
jgi:hypothetical protein